MAEGGNDLDETGTFDTNEGGDDRTPLLPRGNEMEMRPTTSTPITSTSKRDTATTSFIDGTPSGRIFVERAEQQKEDINSRIKKIFPNARMSKIITRIDEYGRVIAKLDRKGGKEFPILDADDYVIIDYRKSKSPSPEFLDLLGNSASEIINENAAENERAERRIIDLDNQITNSVGEERERLVGEREREQEGINERNQENEAIEERLPLRQRIKEIFRKYGFTVIAVSTAIATVIGVIVSNLKVGLAKVAQGVGNGLKELGAKLGQILPGMIGAIASFIFRTAGEVIGFLAKNAWLLIVGLVLFAIEQLKNKKK